VFPGEDAGVRTLLSLALEEDLGSGDVTTLATVPPHAPARAVLRFRDPGVTAGLAIFAPLVATFRARGRAGEEAETLTLVDCVGDAQQVAAGAPVCALGGSARPLLTLERTFLNFVARLSGIATLTHAYVQAVRAAGAKTRILDTRKTTPGWRVLEKYAVACGGGENHRMGLFDAVLVKDNHVQAAGGIGAAVRRAIAATPRGMTIEVECDTAGQVDEALAAGATALLLDNFTPAEVEAAVKKVAGRARIEVSGGVTLETVAAYARAGADDISIGRLTHSAPALDVTLELEIGD
jgi:nicotinate-nucleotide pyrophosphorylase (carboxylating)